MAILVISNDHCFMKTICGEKIWHILPVFAETCDFFFFFLIFQNESAAGNVIQLNKRISLTKGIN